MEDFLKIIGSITVIVIAITGPYKEIKGSGIIQDLGNIFAFIKFGITRRIAKIDEVLNNSTISDDAKENLLYEKNVLYLRKLYGFKIENLNHYEFITGYKDKSRAYSLYKTGHKYLKINLDQTGFEFKDLETKNKITRNNILGFIFYCCSVFLLFIFFYYIWGGLKINFNLMSNNEKNFYLIIMAIFLTVCFLGILKICTLFFRTYHAKLLISLERI